MPDTTKRHPLLFLDIDGVLNQLDRLPNGFYGISTRCVEWLNHIIYASGAGIVISSSWRYMIHDPLGDTPSPPGSEGYLSGKGQGVMDLEGFRYLLLIHGLSNLARIVGVTCRDEVIAARGEQIDAFLHEWVSRHGPTRYVVLDDGGNKLPGDPGSTDLLVSLKGRHSRNFVQTNGRFGLRERDVDRAIEILLEGREATNRA